MKVILQTVLVSTLLGAAAVRPVAAQQLDPAALEATAARLNLTDRKNKFKYFQIINEERL